jgi:hypothetical protein
MRGEAFHGLGRSEEAKAALSGAAQRYEELDDDKTAAAIRERIENLDAKEADEAEAPEPAVS